MVQSTVAGKDQRRSLREHSPNVRQQLVLDHTLPTPGTFYSSAMVSSTPANEELQGMPSDIRAAADDGSFIASYNGTVCVFCSTCVVLVACFALVSQYYEQPLLQLLSNSSTWPDYYLTSCFLFVM